MEEKVTLYHPELDTTITVAAPAARVHRKSGWIDAEPAGSFERDDSESDSNPSADVYGT